MKTIHLTQGQARTRLIAPDDMVSCNLAFIDCKGIVLFEMRAGQLAINKSKIAGDHIVGGD